METRTLALKERSYDIITASGAIGAIGSCIAKRIPRHHACIITNPYLKRTYARTLVSSLARAGIHAKVITAPDTEKSKSLFQAKRLLDEFATFDKQKGAFLVAFGGGVVGDLAGFIAAIYKRGTPYVQVPTTLLAQVDSAIGGKTGVDLPQGKNLVGAFHQPKLVFCDISFLKTLPDRQLRSGLAEIIKYALIKDARLFAFLEAFWPALMDTQGEALLHVVKRCSDIKADIVEQDERELKGIRTILNFGHTIGHALETATGYRRYTHGEAIALGMMAALSISRSQGLVRKTVLDRTARLLENVGLPVRIKGVKLSAILNAHFHDKKFSGAKNKLVLLEDIGKVIIREGVPLATISAALRACSAKPQA